MERLPDDVPFARFATVEEVSSRRLFISARGVTDVTIVELYPRISRSLLDSDYTILSGDNEGFEAEIFFDGRTAAGTYLLRQGVCEEQVVVQLLYSIKPKGGG